MRAGAAAGPIGDAALLPPSVSPTARLERRQHRLQGWRSASPSCPGTQKARRDLERARARKAHSTRPILSPVPLRRGAAAKCQA